MTITPPPAFSASSNQQVSMSTTPLNKEESLSSALETKPLDKKWSLPSNHTLLTSSLKHSYSTTNEYPISMEHARKVQLFKNALRTMEDPVESLNMIDAVQRLGIDYHFRDEINAILQWQYDHHVYNGGHGNNINGYDLYEIALRFRLLRQNGYHISTDVFNNFMDNEGKFKQILCEDIKGLMGLYEASQMSIEEEVILEEAREFSTKLLNTWLVANSNSHQSKLVGNTLSHPHHKSFHKFTASNFFGDSHATNEWINIFQDMAKMDFHLVQSLHQKEVVEVSKWWSDMGLAAELKFARDQPLKWYICTLACFTDPNFSEQRVDLTKPISFIFLIDDIYDVYGTLDDLTLFTEAVNRWDFDASEKLPKYMKTCFRALDGITNDISFKVHQKHGYNPLQSLRTTWQSLCSAFLVEARWFASGNLPKSEEYLKIGIISSGVHVVLVHLFCLLGEGLNQETVDQLVDSNPDIISSVALILRLWDDLGNAKDENQDGKDGSYIDCYMKEHKGSSTEATRKHVMNMISNQWKKLNQECLSPNPFPVSFTNAALNIARMVPLLYSYDQNQDLPELVDRIKSLFYDSILIYTIL